MDTSHEIFANIEHEISQLDNDISITNESDPFALSEKEQAQEHDNNFEIQTPLDFTEPRLIQQPESFHTFQNDMDANPMSLFEAAYKESSLDDFKNLKLDLDSIASIEGKGILDVLKDEEFTSIGKIIYHFNNELSFRRWEYF